MSVSSRWYAWITVILLTVGNSTTAPAELIVSIDDLEVGSDGRGTVNVFVENLFAGVAASLDNLTVTIGIQKSGGAGTGDLLVIDNNTPQTTRDTDPRHVFQGTIPVFFNARPVNSSQSVEVIDSVGLLDFPSAVFDRRLLTSFDIIADPIDSLLETDSFEVSIDASESAFFDAPFSQIPTGDLVFQTATITVRDPSAIPEPGALFLIGVVACTVVTPRSRRRV